MSEFESGRTGGDFGTQFRTQQQALDPYAQQYDPSNQQTGFGSFGGDGQQYEASNQQSSFGSYGGNGQQSYQGGLDSYGGFGSDLGGSDSYRSLRRAGDVEKLTAGDKKLSRT